MDARYTNVTPDPIRAKQEGLPNQENPEPGNRLPGWSAESYPAGTRVKSEFPRHSAVIGIKSFSSGSGGLKVLAGQVVGYVGKMQTVSQSMLHFEFYTGLGKGPLTDRTQKPFSSQASRNAVGSVRSARRMKKAS